MIDSCCGNCRHFYDEDSEGFGRCKMSSGEVTCDYYCFHWQFKEYELIQGVNDDVNSPKHYTQGKIETIDYIEDMGYIEGNIIKYISRYKYKGKPIEDLKKARWYIDRLIKKEEELL